MDGRGEREFCCETSASVKPQFCVTSRNERTEPVKLKFGPNFQKSSVCHELKLFCGSLQDTIAKPAKFKDVRIKGYDSKLGP